ncbi:extracellular solute-binding protein family 1 [Caldalkalibacillus thermarum TA2.A1]|uniref:ABC transporter substrate-binding protein n=1 Tax=Caldalkalibacillus thermarum (strain TA2.A1) TaxID=986075 RepID=F5L3Y7_CALTT|nr:ABC transporter substrate-binding protein [Caldalkalibacillus thermarum]EGL83949.1 extracellular solute-binding protein family 1 [Caldalkalibacillus thermarum TA2.A1]QZT32585.1 ABC transporter substrate-binding protein [Caldalkalibacillus thermarum TA2.A1]
MKRFRLLTLVVGLVLVLLTACGGNDTATNDAATDEGGKEQVTLRLSGWVSSESETRVLREQIALFEEKYPHIKVNYEPISGDYMQQIQMMMASNDEPDVFYMDVAFAQDYIAQDVLVDLTPFIEAHGTDVDDFYPNLLEGFSKDGAIYGLPKDYSTLALVYNVDMFEEAGVEVPTTWDELVEVAKALTTDERKGLSMSYELGRVGAFLYQNGAEFVSEDGTVKVNSPEAIEAVEFYAGLREEHGVADTPANLGDGWQGESFKNEHAAMVVEGPWIVGYLQDEAPELNYKVAELPYSKQPATYAFTVAYVMGQNSAHKEEAFKLIEFLTGPEAQQITVEGGLALPSRMSLAEDFIEKYPEREAWVLGGDYARPYTLGLNFGRKNQIIDSAVEAVFLGQKTAEEALNEAQQEIDALNP